MGVTEFVFEVYAFKTKYRPFLDGSSVAMVTRYVTLMSASIGLSYGIITLLLNEKIW